MNMGISLSRNFLFLGGRGLKKRIFYTERVYAVPYHAYHACTLAQNL